jgi:tetratricopeptide (TPR) repeat protein
MRSVVVKSGVIALMCAVLTACAAKAPPVASAAAPKFAEFMYPALSPALRTSPAAPLHDRGWQHLQAGDLGAAESDFGAALKRSATFYPAHAGAAYVALARRNYDQAVKEFDTALRGDAQYVPALVGRGQALLGLNRDADALDAFEQAVAIDPSLADTLRSRLDVLRFRTVQDVIARARSAAAAGRVDDARAAYGRAIATSPDSAFLYHELGSLERKQGDTDQSLEHLRKAVALDPTDAPAFIEIGAILEERRQFDAALESYRKAAALEPGAELEARIAAATIKARDAKLPPQFQAIAQSPQVTRGELAALLGLRLDTVLRSVPPRQVVATDIRNHWAAPWIGTVLNAGVMDAYQNHTFQPQGRVRRGDLATAVSRVVALMAQRRPDLREQMAQRPKVADMSTGHLDYPAVAVAVSTGVLPLIDGKFQVSRAVSGAEAVDAVARLQRLAGLR